MDGKQGRATPRRARPMSVNHRRPPTRTITLGGAALQTLGALFEPYDTPFIALSRKDLLSHLQQHLQTISSGFRVSCKLSRARPASTARVLMRVLLRTKSTLVYFKPFPLPPSSLSFLLCRRPCRLFVSYPHAAPPLPLPTQPPFPPTPSNADQGQYFQEQGKAFVVKNY